MKLLVTFIGLMSLATVVFSFVFVVFSVPLALLTGKVLSDLWFWFIVPLGVPAIGIAHACGITSIPAIFLASVAKSKADEKGFGNAIIQYLGLALGVIMLWGFGAICHSFM